MTRRKLVLDEGAKEKVRKEYPVPSRHNRRM
jgi:hypothetical protein